MRWFCVLNLHYRVRQFSRFVHFPASCTLFHAGQLCAAMRPFVIISLLTLCLWGPPQTAQADDPPLLFAAASLRGVLEAVFADPATAPTISYGGSATLARQVAQGAPADAVLLANPDWVDWLGNQGATLPGSARDIIGNSLVVIGPPDAPMLSTTEAKTLASQMQPQDRLALGQHQSVPAGIYAAAWLKASGQWDTLSQRLAETENVRLALALVSRRETPLGIVYRSDAVAEPRVAKVYDIPPEAHPPIRYRFAAMTPQGADLAPLLQGATAQQLFVTAGFAALAEGASQ